MTTTHRERSSIHVQEHLPHPPHQVWEALTDPDLLARWLAPNDFALRKGHRFTLRMEPIPAADFDGITHCQVLDFERWRRLQISWRAGPLDTTVTWTLEPSQGGTLLRTVHDGFDAADPIGAMAYRGMSSGWRSTVMRDLRRVLGSGSSA